MLHKARKLNTTDNSIPQQNVRTLQLSLTFCPDRITSTFCQEGSVAIFLFTKYCSCSCKRAIKSVPGVEGKKDCDKQTELP